MARRKTRGVELEGADDLLAALKKLGDRTTGLLLKQAAEKGAQIIADEAKVLAPKDEGDLSEGIKAEANRQQQGRSTFDVGFGKAEWYGRLHELGTDNIPAQPFLRPALETKAEEATEAIEDMLRDALKEVL